MSIFRRLAGVILLSSSSFALAAEGLVQIKSADTVTTTADRFEEAAQQRGLNIFARIDHSAGAEKVGKTLRPTELLIFGGPKVGTAFMECAQTVGIDLPMKALIWQDEQGQVWLGYNDPGYLANRHDAQGCSVVSSISKALSELADIATKVP